MGFGAVKDQDQTDIALMSLLFDDQRKFSPQTNSNSELNLTG